MCSLPYRVVSAATAAGAATTAAIAAAISFLFMMELPQIRLIGQVCRVKSSVTHNTLQALFAEKIRAPQSCYRNATTWVSDTYGVCLRFVVSFALAFPSDSKRPRSWRGLSVSPSSPPVGGGLAGKISAWSIADACAPCADRPSYARPCGRRGSAGRPGAGGHAGTRRIPAGRGRCRGGWRPPGRCCRRP